MLPARYKPLTASVMPGGFGSVQRVQDTYLDRTVLFKSMQDKANNHQLLSEIQGLSRARSRHVVEIYDVIKSEDGTVVGIVIEFLTGSDYLDFHSKAQTSAHQLVRTLYQIGCALRDLHAVGIIHRDLKLDNMRNSASGLLKLFDFGLSVTGVDYRTKINRGTLIYAAPELHVTNAVITQQMDIYALGVCAWALVSDVWPKQLCERPPQQSAAVPSIDTALPGLLHPELVQIVDACLIPDPARRPSAADFSKTFARHLTQGQHKGLFTQGEVAVYELSNAKPNVSIAIGSLGTLKATYDGLVFQIVGVTGAVYVNNHAAVAGQTLHESCVLTFGGSHLGSDRQWVTFSSSQPEVIL
jgi:serine/threonine-protein kinase